MKFLFICDDRLCYEQADAAMNPPPSLVEYQGRAFALASISIIELDDQPAEILCSYEMAPLAEHERGIRRIPESEVAELAKKTDKRSRNRGKPCSACIHKKRAAIDAALVVGQSYREISGRFGVSKSALSRHLAEHIPGALARVAEAKEVANASSLLERIETLILHCQGIADVATQQGEWSGAVAALREIRGSLELIGKISGQLRAGTTTLGIQVGVQFGQNLGTLDELDVRAVVEGRRVRAQPTEQLREELADLLETISARVLCGQTEESQMGTDCQHCCLTFKVGGAVLCHECAKTWPNGAAFDRDRADPNVKAKGSPGQDLFKSARDSPVNAGEKSQSQGATAMSKSVRIHDANMLPFSQISAGARKSIFKSLEFLHGHPSSDNEMKAHVQSIAKSLGGVCVDAEGHSELPGMPNTDRQRTEDLSSPLPSFSRINPNDWSIRQTSIAGASSPSDVSGKAAGVSGDVLAKADGEMRDQAAIVLHSAAAREPDSVRKSVLQKLAADVGRGVVPIPDVMRSEIEKAMQEAMWKGRHGMGPVKRTVLPDFWQRHGFV